MFSKFSLLILFPALLFFLALSGCAKKEEIKVNPVLPIPVKVIKVELKDLNKVLEYVGDIKAQDEVMIYPKVTGKIIEKLKDEGVVVNKAEAIVYIDRDEVGLKFNKAPVESPIAGVVGRVYVDIGSNVSPQTPVALVVNMDKVKISLDIPEKYIPSVYLGQDALINVDSYPEKVFKGQVSQISPVVNLENRAAPIEITIDNQEHYLRSGMFAKVSIIIEEHKKVPVIMKEAVIGKEPDTYIYVIEDNKAVFKKVSLGIRKDPFYEVTEGLKEGELIVIVGQQRLYENAAVIIDKNNGLNPGAKQ
ncbi:MAG: efflux RND transporter periplasmic adaptor subunit [Candidatus Omnitrophota bacterium]